MKTFKQLLEDDNEYWASMPHEFLHAETHNHLSGHGFTSHESRLAQHTWRKNYSFHMDNEQDEINRLDDLRHGFQKHGWKPVGDHHEEDTMLSWKHPNGSMLHLDIDAGQDHQHTNMMNAYLTARMHGPRAK